MSIFLIFRVVDVAKMEAALEAHFPDKFMKIQPGEFLVSASGTAQALAQRLGIIEGDTGAAIVFKMESYYGRAPTVIWDWIKSEAEAVGG